MHDRLVGSIVRSIVTVATALALVVGIGLLGAGPAEAKKGHRHKAHPTFSAPARVTAGKAFHVTGRKHGAHGSRLHLQRKAGSGTWHTVATKRLTRHHHVVVFTRRESRTGTVRFRVKLGARVSAARSVTVRSAAPATHPPAPHPPAPQTMLMMSAGMVGSDADLYVGDGYTVSGTLTKGSTPLANQKVTVERQAVGAKAFAPVGTFTTDDQGEFAFEDSSADHGVVQYQGSVVGSSIQGFVAVLVFEVVPLPHDGPQVKLTTNTNVAAGCTFSAAGDDDAVQIALKGGPGCSVQPQDFVDIQWTLPGSCTPVSFAGITVASGPPGNARARLEFDVDGDQFLGPEEFAVASGFGKVKVSGDPVDMVQVRMTVTGPAGDYATNISNLEAKCL